MQAYLPNNINRTYTFNTSTAIGRHGEKYNVLRGDYFYGSDPRVAVHGSGTRNSSARHTLRGHFKSRHCS